MEVFVLMTCEFERGGQSIKADISGIVDANEYPTRNAIFERVRQEFIKQKKPDADTLMVLSFSVEPNQVAP